MNGEVDTSIDMETARALVANSVLWGPVRDFLFDFAPQIHPSHLAGEVWLAGGGVPAAPRLRKYLLERLGVEPCFHSFPADDGSRLALLDSATLLAIAGWLGALACSRQLRRVTGGAAVKALKTGLDGAYPAVFAYAAYFHDFPELEVAGDDPAGLAAKVVERGCGLLLSLLSDLPAPLASRLRLKLPADLVLPASPDKAAASPQTVLLLLKLKFPEAHSLCCS